MSNSQKHTRRVLILMGLGMSGPAAALVPAATIPAVAQSDDIIDGGRP